MLVTLLSFQTISLEAKGKKIVGEEVIYKANGRTMKGYVAYDKAQKGKRPGVLVVHEWWGCNEYAKKRARMLANLGYIAIAVDLYGDGKIAPDPASAKAYAEPFYKNPILARQLLEAGQYVLRNYPQTDDTEIGAIGYCFGGSVLLNMARMGMPFMGVVSFHGGLDGVPASAATVNTNILVCHGEADSFVSSEEVQKFHQEMRAAQIPYSFISYSNATHAFTNPDATAVGQQFGLPIEYNEAADLKSWNDMADFLKKAFAPMPKAPPLE
ncbi:MAG: dienelactone hydrolase family protein [Bacteroidetes bacterium]|nr:dienelactone hydrolase family protein [Bacteroidota bacterium]